MRIEIIADDSITRQARTYAEYRLFSAVSQVVDTRRVKSAVLVVRRPTPSRHDDAVLCTVSIELNSGDVVRLRAAGNHPYAAINRAVHRLRHHAWPARQDSSNREMAATFQVETGVSQ